VRDDGQAQHRDQLHLTGAPSEQGTLWGRGDSCSLIQTISQTQTFEPTLTCSSIGLMYGSTCSIMDTDITSTRFIQTCQWKCDRPKLWIRLIAVLSHRTCANQKNALLCVVPYLCALARLSLPFQFKGRQRGYSLDDNW
jgi:hypothetical protein